MKAFSLAFILILSNPLLYADEVAITFDDLPSAENGSTEFQREINDKILHALKKYNAPAIGFVTECKLYINNQPEAKTAILKSWIDEGHLLGNHSYSHLSLSKSKLQECQADVVKGALVSKKLMEQAGHPFRYFRHPFLDTGPTKQIHMAFENFLKKEGYIIAPVTIHADDWRYNDELYRKSDEKEKIIARYLAHTRAAFAFYKKASEKIFGRNIKHVWLLHVNLINSYVMEDLLKMVHELGYEVVTLDRALGDRAYSKKDHYYSSSGTTWLYRWDITRGKIVRWEQAPHWQKKLSPPKRNAFFTHYPNSQV